MTKQNLHEKTDLLYEVKINQCMGILEILHKYYTHLSYCAKAKQLHAFKKTFGVEVLCYGKLCIP